MTAEVAIQVLLYRLPPCFASAKVSDPGPATLPDAPGSNEPVAARLGSDAVFSDPTAAFAINPH